MTVRHRVLASTPNACELSARISVKGGRRFGESNSKYVDFATLSAQQARKQSSEENKQNKQVILSRRCSAIGVVRGHDADDCKLHEERG